MKITYSTDLSRWFYDVVAPTIKDRSCPFCGARLIVSNFAGVFHYEGEPRLLHKDITCLMQYAEHIKEIGE